MVQIIALIVGIIGFAKRRINVSKTRELRGGGTYLVASLFSLPLPLSFVVGAVLGANAAAAGRKVDQDTLLYAGLLSTWGPVAVALVLAFVLAKPKVPP